MNDSPIIIGGGAAGYFAAINCAAHSDQASNKNRVILLEKSLQPLAKVRISGGGRCNVTHACFDPKSLIKFYPRGSQELLGPFNRFQPTDTINWFKERGVLLKTEEDGRMFPITDNSETIINCLQSEITRLKVDLRLGCGVEKIEKKDSLYTIHLYEGAPLTTHRLLIATGSSPRIYPILESLGHTIIPLVPSLFTFNIPDSPLLDLAGISINPVTVKILNTPFEYTGPLLLTHWGLSGPVILKLSAWGARYLHSVNYKSQISINWLPDQSENDLSNTIWSYKESFGRRQIGTETPFPLSKQLWKRLIECAKIDPEQKWLSLSKKELSLIISQLRSTQLSINGKTTYKQEFVTCGGVSLKEINFKRMESRISPGLFFAGEVLDIDGITGGFNFQNAWTTGWIAGESMVL
jgi:predicted Rossmann fold flavoprotein